MENDLYALRFSLLCIQCAIRVCYLQKDVSKRVGEEVQASEAREFFY